jgi:hypothetical protein
VRAAPYRRRGEGGFTAIEFALAVALILVPLGAARVVAAEAARAAAAESSWASATSAGAAMAAQVAGNYGLRAEALSVSFSGSVERGGSVTATVGVVMPVLRVPGVGGAGGWTWTTSHAQPTDLYRSRRP